MRRDLVRTLPLSPSSFLSCEKDTETILRRLFIESQPYSNVLKKLLVINTKDCLDDLNKQKYQEIIDKMSLSRLCEEGYINFAPTIKMKEHEDVKASIILSYDSFVPTSNPQFRDTMVSFDIICHTDCWNLSNYGVRAYKIAGYIDGILNNSKLSGIGTLQFAGFNLITFDENLAGGTLMYRATHGSDDRIPAEDA